MQNYWVTNPPFLFFCRASKRQSGFTLVELMVTVTVAAILLAVGIPSFRSAIVSNRLTSTTNDLVGTLAQARSEAIRRGSRVTVCMSSDGASCATSGSWEQGWISFLDATRPGTTAIVGTGEAVIAVTQRDSSSTVVVGSTAVEQYVSFASDGTAKLMSGAAQSGTLRVCETSSTLNNARRSRDIQVAAVGRLSTTTPTSVAANCPAPP
jgi:type IV fimbrial biogenesis protein FimT